MATEKEAGPAESTGPTVNIQTTEVAEAESAHTAAEPALTIIPAEPAEAELGCIVTLDRDSSDSSSADPPAASVNCEESVIPGSAPSLEQVHQCASVKAEMQPEATTPEFDESLSESSAEPESAEKENMEVIDEEEEEENAGVDREPLVSENGNIGVTFTVTPAYIGGCEKEKLSSTEEEVKCCLEALENELTDCKHAEEGNETEVDAGKRVQFSHEVEYFEEEEFPTGLKDVIEKVDEQVDECLPAEDEEQKISADTQNPLPFEKEKYHYPQTDSSDDEVEREEEEEEEEVNEMEEEAEKKFNDKELNLKPEEDSVDEEASEGGDVLVSEELEEEPTETPPPPSPPAMSQSEVTPRQRQGPLPRPCNLTTTSCWHNLLLIIKGPKLHRTHGSASPLPNLSPSRSGDMLYDVVHTLNRNLVICTFQYLFLHWIRRI